MSCKGHNVIWCVIRVYGVAKGTNVVSMGAARPMFQATR